METKDLTQTKETKKDIVSDIMHSLESEIEQLHPSAKEPNQCTLHDLFQKLEKKGNLVEELIVAIGNHLEK